MSSFVGHGLAALTIGKAFEKNAAFKSYLLWQACLILCVYAPDVDYIVPSLNRYNNGGLRITHSIAFSLILPVLFIFFLTIFDRKNLFWKGLSLCLAGLSHLFLDLLVGSRNGDPLFYPFFNKAIALPFGILPGAGAVKLSNYYFYRNLLIEIGILVPAFIFILVILNKLRINKFVSIGLFCVFVIFLVWSFNLKR